MTYKMFEAIMFRLDKIEHQHKDIINMLNNKLQINKIILDSNPPQILQVAEVYETPDGVIVKVK